MSEDEPTEMTSLLGVNDRKRRYVNDDDNNDDVHEDDDNDDDDHQTEVKGQGRVRLVDDLPPPSFCKRIYSIFNRHIFAVIAAFR